MHNNESMKSKLALTFLLSVTTVSPVVTAAIYKWVDIEGNVHYTQSPPLEAIKVEEIEPPSKKVEEIEPPSKIDAESALPQWKEEKRKADESHAKRLEQAKQEAIRKENKAIKKENCRRSRERLRTYSRPRGRILQKDGSRKPVIEDERQVELAKSKEMIEKYCN